MILIGENLNIMSRTIGPAIRNMDKKPVQELAVAEQAAGMDYLDLNLGPARKQGAELMEWLVNTVQEVVDLPLFLDTMNPEAIEAGLKACRRKPVINSISLKPQVMDALLPLVKKYECGFVGLLLGADGIPRDGGERGALAAEMLAKAAEEGISEESIWFDPIVLPVSSQQDQVLGCTEFMEMFSELAPMSKSTCGLSNVSNGVPAELRNILNQTYMIMLQKHGLSSAIVDAFDKELVAIAGGQRDELKDAVWSVMDGGEPAGNQDYVKTAKVLMGQSLYSHSWLKI